MERAVASGTSETRVAHAVRVCEKLPALTACGGYLLRPHAAAQPHERERGNPCREQLQ